MSMAVLPRVLDLSLATSVMEPARMTSPSMVVPCCRVKILLPSPVTETEEPLMLLLLPAVVVTVASVIGAKKVWPPEMKMADFAGSLACEADRAQIHDARAVDDIAGAGVHRNADGAGGVGVGDRACIAEEIVGVDGDGRGWRP